MNPRGYFQTPNVNIPLNKRDPGTIADVAKQQLEQYQALALVWGTTNVYRDQRHCVVCSECRQCLWFRLDPNGNEYLYSDEELQTLKVGHIRQAHAEVIPDGTN